MLDALAAILKTLLYAGILTSSGAVFFAATLRGSPVLEEVANRTMRRGAILFLSASVLGAIVLVFRLGGRFDAAMFSAVFSSSTGAALFIQLTAATLLLTIGEDRSARGIALVSAALATLSIAFNGHAAAAGPFEGMFVLLHASAAAWWVGSLWLLRSACQRLPVADLAQLVPRFSLLATQIVGGLVITGLLLVLVLVEFEELPALSAYERNLAIKLLLVALVLGLASYNKFRLTPRLFSGEAAAALSLRRVIEVELVIIAAVLVATAILTTYSSPHESIGD